MSPLPWRAGLLDFLRTRRQLDLFLDFDGTLTEIAPHPDDAALATETRALLLRLAARPRTRLAIVSGRHVAGLVKRLDHPAIGLVGIHGLEWRRLGVHGEDEAATRVRPAMARIAAAIRDAVRATPGAALEDKGSSLSLHLRAAEPGAAAELLTALLAAAAAEPDVRCFGGSGVVEVRPVAGPNKGTAIVQFLVATHGAAWAEQTAAVFVGDDVTDEDGFVALGDGGAGVIVAATERPTAARWRATSVEDVYELLVAILAA